jgi:hemerythrin-like domain-containing protein
MIEHRLIEKMFRIAQQELDAIEGGRDVNPVFIDTMVDFIRTYADRTHHGKEEDILFRELEKKDLDEKNARLMRELVDEHIHARKVVGELMEAKERYVNGEAGGLATIVEKMKFLIEFYPQHIDKEDTFFFPDTEAYFSSEELDAMLAEFYEFDRSMIHEKYNRLYESLQADYA